MAAAVALAVGCGSDDKDSSSSGGGTTAKQTSTNLVNPPKDLKPLASIGKGEGKVNLIAWAGYVEDGSTDPKVDWVSDFEKQTGCQVSTKVGNTSDEMV